MRIQTGLDSNTMLSAACRCQRYVSTEHTCQFVKQVVHQLFIFSNSTAIAVLKIVSNYVTTLEIERIHRCADVHKRVTPFITN